MKSLPNSLVIRLVQMCSKNNKEKNIQELLEHLESLALEDEEMIFLPENSLFMREGQKEKVEPFDLNQKELKPLQDFCRNKKIFLHLGAIPVLEAEHIYNASVHILPNGEMIDSYRKMHLFDVEVEKEKLIRESDAYKAGLEIKSFYYKDIHFGQTICYDLRFSNLFLAYANLEVEVILVPSAFFYVTGKDHWEVLLRSRAIETQAFVIAAAQGGSHGSGKQKTWGQSMVVDPWGHVVAEIKESQDKPQSIRYELDLDKVKKVRRQIPLAAHRRKM